jgi:superfamily II DNA/RNA helicase
LLCKCRAAADGALILCPSVALCEQVAAVARGLRAADGAPLVSVAFVSTSQPPPHQPPDVTIATPGTANKLLLIFPWCLAKSFEGWA